MVTYDTVHDLVRFLDDRLQEEDVENGDLKDAIENLMSSLPEDQSFGLLLAYEKVKTFINS